MPVFTFSALLLCTLMMSNESYGESAFPVLRGPYLGQKPPSVIPEIFAPDIVSINGRHEGAISFSPKLDEMYFGATNKENETHIYFSTLEDNQWTPIKRADLTKASGGREAHPFASYNGKGVYFTVFSSSSPSPKIWYVDRTEKFFGTALKLDSPINDAKVFYPNQAKNGDLYYTDISNPPEIKTYHAPIKNGRYPEVKEVDIEFGVHGFISPSQDFLVTDGRNKEDENRTDIDIYVYFKKKDGKWGKPINLGNSVNSQFDETVPSITPDGKYLFFGRYNEEGGLSNFYWVSTEVITRLK